MMERQIQLTSFESYCEVKRDGVVGEGQRKVLEILTRVNVPLTDYEIAYFYMAEKDPNKVRPRRNELVKKGKVKSYGSKICGVSGKRAMTWGLT